MQSLLMLILETCWLLTTTSSMQQQKQGNVGTQTTSTSNELQHFTKPKKIHLQGLGLNPPISGSNLAK